VGVSAVRRAAARIAIAGAGTGGSAARAYLRAELEGVRFIAAEGGERDGAASALRDGAASALRDADMLVFVAESDEVPDAASTARLAAAAHERGMLVAALLVGPDRGGASALLAVLRDAADMVMLVRDGDDARAVIAALR
jgi:cell division GTPase FtsZ